MDLAGFPKGPSSCSIGSMSRRLSIFSWTFSLSVDFFVPIEEFMSAPMIWVVLFFARMVEKKSVAWLLKVSSSASLYPECGK